MGAPTATNSVIAFAKSSVRQQDALHVARRLLCAVSCATGSSAWVRPTSRSLYRPALPLLQVSCLSFISLPSPALRSPPFIWHECLPHPIRVKDLTTYSKKGHVFVSDWIAAPSNPCKVRPASTVGGSLFRSQSATLCELVMTIEFDFECELATRGLDRALSRQGAI